MSATPANPAPGAPVSHGADIQALREFAAGCTHAGTALQSTRERLTVALDELSWHGPDATRARMDWHQRHLPALTQVVSAMEDVAARVNREADQQEHTSSDIPGAAVTAAGARGGDGAPVDQGRAERRESRWARVGGALLGRVLGSIGGPLGSALGAVAGPRALNAITNVATDRAARTYITEVPSDQPTGPPQDVAQMMERVQEAYQIPGGIIVETVTGADGTRTAFVYAAGTQDWSFNPGASTNDGSAAVASAMGRDNANRVAMLQALQAHGVDSDTPVVLVGHSQSAKTQLDMAADPYVLARYNIHSVVGAGAGGGQFEVPEHINVVSLRNRLDPVTYAGGAPNNAINVRGTWLGGVHSLEQYTDFARDHRNAELDAWWQQLGLEPGHDVHRSAYSGQVAPREPDGR